MREQNRSPWSPRRTVNTVDAPTLGGDIEKQEQHQEAAAARAVDAPAAAASTYSSDWTRKNVEMLRQAGIPIPSTIPTGGAGGQDGIPIKACPLGPWAGMASAPAAGRESTAWKPGTHAQVSVAVLVKHFDHIAKSYGVMDKDGNEVVVPGSWIKPKEEIPRESGTSKAFEARDRYVAEAGSRTVNYSGQPPKAAPMEDAETSKRLGEMKTKMINSAMWKAPKESAGAVLGSVERINSAGTPANTVPADFQLPQNRPLYNMQAAFPMQPAAPPQQRVQQPFPAVQPSRPAAPPGNQSTGVEVPCLKCSRMGNYTPCR